MQRQFIFRDTTANTELKLPVTPKSFQIEHGISIETKDFDTAEIPILRDFSAL